MGNTDFSSLNLQEKLLQNISSLGYEQMTPIQAQSLPHILANKDVIAQAKTGSGKTAAFGLGILNKLDVNKLAVQGLIVCPTRELADQVAKSVRQLARTIPNIKVITLCGGVPVKPQRVSLEHGAHIVVGTPGRLAKHLRKEYLNVDSLTTLVLDEGDRMLEMGFQEEIDFIVDSLPGLRQTLLFSATYPDSIKSISKCVMVAPVMVKVESTHDETTIKQRFYEVGKQNQRMIALRQLLLQHRPESTVVFCNTKKECMDVTDELIDYGFSALDLHGDLDQRDRDETLVRFANKSISILVATDVAARGLDIDSLDAVINFHISRDCEVHIHRIGRTGRAGSKGLACSFYSQKEHHKVSLLEEFLGIEIESEELPPAEILEEEPIEAQMATIKVNLGRKQKFRPGNILGALTGKNGLSADQVGKIHIFDNWSFVAVKFDAVEDALQKLSEEKWKGRPINGQLIT